MPVDEQVTDAWRNHRSHLVDLAYRMLGDIGEAEDVVQEAFSRLLRATIDDIEDERGWLIVVTSRLCLDQIKSARSRRERSEDTTVLEARAPAAGPASIDPADRVTLDDNVKIALLVVLERLSPAERVVFVLHDIFQMPFDMIAETVGQKTASCRQLARRARQKIDAVDGAPRFSVATRGHRLVTEKFIAACANGDLQGLLEVLDPQVSGEVDLRAALVVTGAEKVARNILRYWGSHATLVSHTIGLQPSLLAFVDRRLAAVLVLTMGTDNRITKIHVIAHDSEMAILRLRLSGHI